MKSIISFLTPNGIKITITLVLAYLVFLIGIIFLKSPIYLKTGCAPIQGTTLQCMYWTFPQNINIYSINFLLIFYLVSCVVSSLFSPKFLWSIVKMLVVVLVFFSLGYKYRLLWVGRCRSFKTNSVLSGREIQCPAIYNPFSWDKFQKDWENR